MKEKVSVPFMLLGILFNVCLIAANLLETKVIQVGSLTVTAGLLVFPISYIINDCIAEVWGFKKARLIIWSGFAMNFFVVGLGLIAVADTCCSVLGRRRAFRFCIRYGSPHRSSQFDGFPCRFIPECVCDE